MSGTPTETVEVPAADSPAVTRRIDLDAARAARRDARRERAGEDAPLTPVLVLNGEDLPLAEELPLSCLTAFGELVALRDVKAGDEVDVSAIAGLEAATAELFGPEVFARVKAGPPAMSVEDLMFLLEQAMELYGFTMGEA